MRIRIRRRSADVGVEVQWWPSSSGLRPLTVNQESVGSNPTGHPKFMPYKSKKDRAEFDRRRRAIVEEAIDEWFSQRPCVDCGNTDRRVLQPDHVRGKKLFPIGRRGQRTLEQVLEELAKCESRCANCHTIRHFEERK